MIEVDLTAAAFEVVRDGVTMKSRRGGVYTVLMPKKLAERLDAARAADEDISGVILRLAEEMKAPGTRRPLR